MLFGHADTPAGMLPAQVRRSVLADLTLTFERNLWGQATGAQGTFAFYPDGRPVAGSAVSYRRIRHGGRELLAGIMTGSWTLPEARGRGAFGQAIEESRRLVASHGGEALLAFVEPDSRGREVRVEPVPEGICVYSYDTQHRAR